MDVFSYKRPSQNQHQNNSIFYFNHIRITIYNVYTVNGAEAAVGDAADAAVVAAVHVEAATALQRQLKGLEKIPQEAMQVSVQTLPLQALAQAWLVEMEQKVLGREN